MACWYQTIMLNYFKAAIKTATSIFFALLGLLILFWIFSLGNDYYKEQQAIPFQKVKNWPLDMQDSLGFKMLARTKFVSNRLLAVVEITGYPKYLADSRNKTGTLTIEFFDKDGFKIEAKTLELSEFTTLLGRNNKPSGMTAQYDEYIDLDAYKRFDSIQLSWNLITQLQEIKPKSAPIILDHCAIGLTKSERIKRLGQYGDLREIGDGSYSAGTHSLLFGSYDGALLHCH